MLPSHVTTGGHASVSLLEFGVTVSLATQDNNVNKVSYIKHCKTRLLLSTRMLCKYSLALNIFLLSSIHSSSYLHTSSQTHSSFLYQQKYVSSGI